MQIDLYTIETIGITPGHRPMIMVTVLLLQECLWNILSWYTRVGTLIVATIYLQLIQN